MRRDGSAGVGAVSWGSAWNDRDAWIGFGYSLITNLTCQADSGQQGRTCELGHAGGDFLILYRGGLGLQYGRRELAQTGDVSYRGCTSTHRGHIT